MYDSRPYVNCSGFLMVWRAIKKLQRDRYTGNPQKDSEQQLYIKIINYDIKRHFHLFFSRPLPN